MTPPRASVLIFAGASYVGLSLYWLGWERSRDARAFPPASVHSLAPEGCANAYRYLRAVGPPGGRAVRILDEPLAWSPIEPDAVVFRLRPHAPPRRVEDLSEARDPTAAPTPDPRKGGPPKSRPTTTPAPVAGEPGPLLRPEEEEWVRGGGRLVLGITEAWRGLRLGAAPTGKPVVKVFPTWPGVRRLEPATSRGFVGDSLPVGHSLYAIGEDAAVWRAPLGKGELVLLSIPEVLTNEALGRADHLALLLALVGDRAVVYFDEDAHGLGRRDGLLGLMLRLGLGPALVLAAASFALLLWRSGVPTGTQDELPPARRSEAVDLVESMAELYDRVLTRRDAIERYRNALLRQVALRTGLKGPSLSSAVEELLGEDTAEAGRGGDLRPSDFARSLARINSAFQRLEEHAHPRTTH